MAAFSNTAENRLIDWLLRGQALGFAGASAGAGSGPVATFVALFTVAPTDGAAGTECAGAGYARVSVASTLANWAGTQAPGSTVASSGTSGTTSNNGTLTFPIPSANWGSIVAAAIMDAATGGSIIFFSAVTPNKTVNNGDPAPSFAPASLSFQLDD